jgi:hypothetical protein
MSVKFDCRVLSIALSFGLLFICAPGAYPQGALQFFDAPWRGFDTGFYVSTMPVEGFLPRSVAVGDMDGDGDADALVGNGFGSAVTPSGSGVSVLKNLGGNTFSLPQIYTLPAHQVVDEVALADIDADGDLDALATNRGRTYNLANIYLWRNNGDGTLAAPESFPTGTGPVGLVVADFTGDNFPDVVTATYGSLFGDGTTVSLLRHNGQTGTAATFLAPVDFNVGTSPMRLAAADLNGDGKLDLAIGRSDLIGNSFGTLTVVLNNGSGGFGSPIDYPAAPGARRYTAAVALRDLDNDGDADLIGGGLISSGSIDNGAITIRRNNGAGVFGNAETFLFPNYVDRPQRLTTGDINGDGFADVLAAAPTGRTTDGWVLLKSNGANGFAPAVRYEASQQTIDVKTADTDRDGDLDVITLARSSTAITVHKNPGNAAFPVLPRYASGEGNSAVESGDIDRDGDQDIVVTSVDIVLSQRTVRVLKNNGNATFAPAVVYSTAPRFYGDAKLRDLNGDGNLDVLLASHPGSAPYDFAVMINQGNGNFAAPVITPVNGCAAGSIDAFDLDNDNDLDVVLTEEGGCVGGAGNRIFIARNNGSANFTLVAPLDPAALPSGIGGGDLNNDGKIDLVTSDTSIGVFLGNGNLTFQPVVNSGTRPTRFTIADFNRDGKLDVGLIEFTGQSIGTDRVGISLGVGNGTFAAAATQTGSSVEEALTVGTGIDAADFDRDGDPDLAVTNYASNDISLFLNNGNGTLRPQQRYGIGSNPSFTAAADFNGDGKIDLASSIGLPPSGLPGAVVVLLNTGANNRSTRFDFDGDGKADISVFRPSSGTWYLQQSTSGFTGAQFGVSTDKIVPADYDGDGKTDLGVYRNGTWYLQRSSLGFAGVAFGAADDIPQPADFDGDGRAEIAVFRPSNGTWYMLNLVNGQFSGVQFGASGDKPVVADYDGDGKADVAVFRSGTWYLLRSQAGFSAVQFGENTDKPTPADYDGDGKADVAVFRPANGTWYLLQSTTGFSAAAFGQTGDLPVAADYDGDGKADISVFRNGTWYLQRSQAGFTAATFGTATDTPVPGAFVP